MSSIRFIVAWCVYHT